MIRRDESGGVGALVRHTADMAELAVSAGHPDRKHNEYLPYPDKNFNETIDEQYQRGNKFTVAHLYDRDGKTFVPNVSVHVTKITSERTYAAFTEFLNPYLYSITVQHGNYEWTIFRRYRHFHELHKTLVHLVEAETRRSVTDINSENEENNEYPCFPTRNERWAWINDDMVDERCKILADYLNKVLKHPRFRAHPKTQEFFDVSCLSFVYGISPSRKEGYLLKRSHDNYRVKRTLFRVPFLCDSCKFHHGEKWFVIKDTYISYIRLDTHEIRFPMLVDRGFEISVGLRNARTYHGIKIKNLQRTLVIKTRSTRDCDEWKEHFTNLVDQAKDFFSSTASRFNSYAPVREKQLAYWFINGKTYMEAVAKALLTAKEEVFITDWWLSPEIMLIRPCDNEMYRLDNVLGRIADNGVRVYIMLFKDMKMVLGLNSLYSKRTLTSMSKKGFIKVIRHPNHSPNGGVLFWSHHEKMVVIDQKIAFIGGIDLCYGRWDDDFMRLVDLGEENDRNLKIATETLAESTEADRVGTVDTVKKMITLMAEHSGEKLATGSDHMKTAFGTVPLSDDEQELDGKTHVVGTGYNMKAVTKKWIESKWTGTDAEENESDSNKDNNDVTSPDNVRRSERYASKWRKLAQKLKKDSEEDSDDEEQYEKPKPNVKPPPVLDTKHRYFLGKDYSNCYEKNFETLDQYSEDYINRKTVPRMPWHDEALVVFGKTARDAARHFIQRWNIHKCEKYIHNNSYPFLLPKSYTDDEDLAVRNWKDFLESKPFSVDAQCVRSSGPWSIGTKSIESSIQNAYIQMIDGAKHYIYIENQFFITIAKDSQIHNQLADILFRRIQRAHQLNEKFRIYVVLPLLPGFDSVNAVQAVLYFIMRSITKGEGSLFDRLEKEGISPHDYICFFGMRNYDILMGNLVTEIIYVHSKLMIIDDHMAICGSANINDRSLLGQRDSEFCVVINDREEETCQFNGQTVRVGKFCSSWRKRLFAMLLGIHLQNPNNIDLSDPISDEFYKYFRDVARKNTLIYEEVFASIPTDRARTFAQVKEYSAGPKLNDTDPIKAYDKLKGIQGFVVEYPIYFLHDENYLPSLRTREGIVPNVTWT